MFNFFNKTNFKIPKKAPAGFNTDFNGFARKYTDENGYNMILSKNLQLSLDSTKTHRNCNLLIDGMSGSGKTRNFVKPNLLQANCSYMIVDAGGACHRDMAEFFKNQGYDVKVLDLQEPSKSYHYNPFEYIEDEKDIRDVVDCIMVNSDHVPFYRHKLDPNLATEFSVQVRAFWSILIAYVANLDNKEDRTFATIHKILQDEFKEEGSLDKIIQRMQSSQKFDFLKKDYNEMQGPETRRRLMLEIALHIQVALIPGFDEMTKRDDIDLRSFGDKKTICFIIVPTANTAYNLLSALIFTQLQNVMEKEAMRYKNSKLPIQVMCVLDELANCGYIPNLVDRLATCRPMNMNYLICIHSISQIKVMYGDDWEKILANCDTFIHFPNVNYMDCEYTRHITGDLISMNDLLMCTRRNECVVCVRGEKPFLDYVYDVEKHENYKVIEQ